MNQCIDGFAYVTDGAQALVSLNIYKGILGILNIKSCNMKESDITQSNWVRKL
jgi:hypothetical protein